MDFTNARPYSTPTWMGSSIRCVTWRSRSICTAALVVRRVIAIARSFAEALKRNRSISKLQRICKSAFSAPSSSCPSRNTIALVFSVMDKNAAPMGAAALVVLLLIPFIKGSSSDELLTQDIVASHIRSLMVNHLADVPSTDEHTVKPWFNGKSIFHRRSATWPRKASLWWADVRLLGQSAGCGAGLSTR